MLPSLSIRNYRNLKSLDIERLARVNLIAGKNNTGKTSLLEAVSLHAAGGDIRWIRQILVERGEVAPIRMISARNQLARKVNPNSYASILYGRKTSFSDSDIILIGQLSNGELFDDTLSDTNRLLIRFVQLREERSVSDSSNRIYTNVIKDVSDSYGDVDLGIEVKFDGSGRVYSMDREMMRGPSYYNGSNVSNYNFQYVKTGDIGNDINSTLWDNVALTEEEAYVIKALQIIEIGVERIAFVSNESDRKRDPVVKLSSVKEVIPLQSMGDGMNRILTIILALVNAKDGYLLIDEFENGLHYTVQEDLWKMIFKLAKELNVQVFATTHSDDCIHAFESVLNSEGNQKEGQYLRLDNIDGQIIPTLYSEKELDTAADQRIEVR